jgi:hypothetical protein
MEGKEIDKKRVLNFACFGLVQGCVAWMTFVKVFSKLTPGSVRFSNLSFAEKLTNRQGQVDVVKQIVLDNFLYTPLVFFPIFYSCKSVVQGADADPLTGARQAAGRYYDNMYDDNVASCKVWLLADLLIFSVPAWIRMPVFQGVNFGFSMVLSHMRGSSEATSKAVGSEVATLSIDLSWVTKLQQRVRETFASLPKMHLSFSY